MEFVHFWPDGLESHECSSFELDQALANSGPKPTQKRLQRESVSGECLEANDSRDYSLLDQTQLSLPASALTGPWERR